MTADNDETEVTGEIILQIDKTAKQYISSFQSYDFQCICQMLQYEPFYICFSG